jgi:hypothetical protein
MSAKTQYADAILREMIDVILTYFEEPQRVDSNV